MVLLAKHAFTSGSGRSSAAREPSSLALCLDKLGVTSRGSWPVQGGHDCFILAASPFLLSVRLLVLQMPSRSSPPQPSTRFSSQSLFPSHSPEATSPSSAHHLFCLSCLVLLCETWSWSSSPWSGFELATLLPWLFQCWDYRWCPLLLNNSLLINWLFFFHLRKHSFCYLL